MLIVVAIVGVVSMMAIPTLQHMIYRARIEGFARQASLLFQQCRYEAIKRGVDCVVEFNTVRGDVFGYADIEADLKFVPDPAATDFRSTDYAVGTIRFPAGVDFGAPGVQTTVFNFTDLPDLPWNGPVFQSDGSVRIMGGVRFGDQRGNYLEARVEPAATARVRLRKWDGTAWLAQGEGGKTWEWL